MNESMKLTEKAIPICSSNSGDAFERPSELIYGAAASRNIHPIMAHWVPVMGICSYLILKPMLQALCNRLKTNGKSQAFRSFALLHNILLCVYSGWTSYHCARFVYRYTMENGIEKLYCDPALWENGLHLYGFLFYLSKYYELFDTALLIVKRRRVIYLQTYHHAATIYGAYLLVVTHASVTFIFVIFNSTVHTIMYFYYAMSVIGVRLPGKSWITALQMVQFFVGILAAFPIYVLRGGRCGNSIQYVAVAALMAHAGYLLFLFLRFYKEQYHPKKVV